MINVRGDNSQSGIISQIDVTDISINIPVNRDKLEGYETRKQLDDQNNEEVVFGPRQRAEDLTEEEDENIRRSKLNVMDSEILDDVESEISRGTDRPSKTIA